jgi:PAS domain S-box-containing protein
MVTGKFRRHRRPPPMDVVTSRFETLFAEAPFSMQLLARDGRTLRVNRAWEALWQVSDGDGVKEWVLGGEYNVLTDPQLAAKGVTPHLRRAFEQGEMVEIPATFYDPAELGRPGRARWVAATAHPVRDEAGAVREVMLIHRDVTEQFKSEQALQQSEQRLRLAIDAARIGIWDWDIDRDVVTWTPEVYALHGLEPGTFGGTSQAFAERVLPDDLAMVWGRIQQAVAEESGFDCQFRVRLPAGGDRWLSTSSRVYRGVDGGRRMVGATFSIDPYKKAEEALRDLDHRKDEFLAMLAHELRNPLAPIRTAAEALLIAPQDAQVARKASEVIARQMRHVTKLVDDLLDVSRVTRGLVTLDADAVDLAGVVRGAVEQATPLLQARRHTLRTSLEGGSLVARGDRARLTQVVANLLNNAARYTPEGGLIQVTLASTAAEALVKVEDNGQGIDASLLSRIFELFTQGPRTIDRASGGLGIGLALVRRLAELHGGSVEAHSAGPGQGSRFVLRLPRVLERPAGEPAEAPAAGRSKALRVVIVDDNQDAADTLAMLLEVAGHQVHRCYNAASALALPASREADVFLLDIGLPDLDGLELGQRLRRQNSHALLIAASGYGQPADIARSREAGFDHHLVKPITFEALAATLRARHEPQHA